MSTDLAKISTGEFLQDFSDISEGNLGAVLQNGAKNNGANMGGLMVYGNKLIGSSYIYYDGSVSAKLSHFTHSLTLSQSGSFKGMYAVGTLNPGFYAGYMAQIPSEWQSAFGGPALTGQCCIAIISRSSLGPAAFVFNPDDLGKINPVTATPLVYYPAEHPTLGDWGGKEINLYYNMATTVNGIVFPTGTRSLLFIGTQATGVPCYGIGVSTSQPKEGECYDPASSSKGTHGYPYKYWVWAYDANDLLTVKNGEKNPWDIRPYAVWSLDLPGSGGGASIQGVAYDPGNQRLYVSQGYADKLVPGAGQYDAAPLIQVFSIKINYPIAP